MSLRAAFGAIVVGLTAAFGIFFWTEYQTGRLGEVLAFVRDAEKAGPPPLVTRPAPTVPSRAPSPTQAPTPTSCVSSPIRTRALPRVITTPWSCGWLSWALDWPTGTSK